MYIYFSFGVMVIVFVSSAVDRGFEPGSGERSVWRYQRGNQNPYVEEVDNTMAKIKYKSTSNDLQNIHIKLKIE